MSIPRFLRTEQTKCMVTLQMNSMGSCKPVIKWRHPFRKSKSLSHTWQILKKKIWLKVQIALQCCGIDLSHEMEISKQSRTICQISFQLALISARSDPFLSKSSRKSRRFSRQPLRRLTMVRDKKSNKS